MTEEKKGVLPEVIPAEDEIQELFNQYQTLKETLEQIKGGAAYLNIHSPGAGFTDLKCMNVKEDDFLKRIKGDIMMGLRETRQQLIQKLKAEADAELGYPDKNNRNVEPFSAGTPKNDYRRHSPDTDDGKRG